jgi:lipoyl(octanoyl) transferase
LLILIQVIRTGSAQIMHTCRLLQDPPRDGLLNMAIDEALLRHAEHRPGPSTTLRLYNWTNPTVSLGYAQRAHEAANLTYCAANGIEVVRRVTGGRAVLHAEELTYAIVSNDAQLFGGSTIQAAYMAIARILQLALQRIGCPAQISPGNIHRRDSGQSEIAVGVAKDSPCFSSTSRFEIVAAGRKLIGSAQRRLKTAFLQHGSILIACDYGFQALALGANPEVLQQQFVGISDFVPKPSVEPMLRRQIPECLQEVLRCTCREGEILQEESLEALHLVETGRHRIILLD